MLKYFSRIKHKIFMKKWENGTTKELIKAFLALETKDEARRFLRDLLTPQEIIEFGKRWKAAQMLAQRNSYTQVTEETGLSSTTVARVAKWLWGSMGGYRLLINRLGIHHCSQTLARRE